MKPPPPGSYQVTVKLNDLPVETGRFSVLGNVAEEEAFPFLEVSKEDLLESFYSINGEMPAPAKVAGVEL